MATYHGRVQVNGCLNRGHLYLRKSEESESTPLAEIPDGTELDVTLTRSNEHFKTTYNGKTGYVRLMDIAITQGHPLYRVNVKSGTLNVRTAPSKNQKKLGFTAAKDRGLYVLETHGDWYLVSCNIGTGWSSKSYLVKDETAVPFDYPTIDEFIKRLKDFCGKGWHYDKGYNNTDKHIDCSNYAHVARYNLGETGASSEYASISDDEKGSITDPTQLKVGMEIFKSDSTNKDTKNHMGVYAGIITFNDGIARPAVYQSRSFFDPKQAAMYSEKTGPNLTEMDSDWDCWAWSKYVQH